MNSSSPTFTGQHMRTLFIHDDISGLTDSSRRQFGNVLVLATVYVSSPPNINITRGSVISVLRRTIRFLERQAFLPPTCKIDHSILCKVLEFISAT